MDWINKNYFKVGILIAIFVILCYAYYFLAIFQPKVQLENNVMACAAEGANFSQVFQAESKQQDPNIISFVMPQYHYSQKSGSCLSENGYVFPDHGGTGTYMVITDVNSNKQILKSVQNIYQQVDPSNGIVTYDEFITQAPSVMSN
jgi:hypothetical protein